MGRVQHLSEEGPAVSEAKNARPEGRVNWTLHRRLRLRAAAWGGAGAVFLALIYVGVLVAANSMEHAVTEFVRLWQWMIPIILGFALQVGLFAYARGVASEQATTGVRAVVASSGTSTLSMVACCAHHLSDVLPLVGLAGAAVFLGAYQSLFLLLGVLSNVVGLAYLLGVIRRHGLFPRERSWLSMSVRWPIDRAFPLVFFLCAAAFAIGILTAVSRR